MARRTRRVLPVLLHLAPQRKILARRTLFERRNRRRRRRRRRVQQVLENPLPAQHGRRPRRIGRNRQHTPVRQNPAAAIGAAHIHPPELRTGHPVHAIEARHPLIQERVLGVQQIQQTSVLPHQVLKKQLRLPAHRKPQTVIKIRKLFNVRLQDIHIFKLQPLPHEIFDERRRLRIAQHPLHLRRKHRRLP